MQSDWRTVAPAGVDALPAPPPDPVGVPERQSFPEFLPPAWPTAAPPSYEPAPYPDLFDGPAQTDEQRRRSHRGLGLALGGLALLVTIAVVALVLLLNGARSATLDTASIEADIAARLSAEAGGSVTVICPDSVVVSSGSTFDCDATGDDGTHVTVVVRQTDDQGNVTWRVRD